MIDFITSLLVALDTFLRANDMVLYIGLTLLLAGYVFYAIRAIDRHFDAPQAHSPRQQPSSKR